MRSLTGIVLLLALLLAGCGGDVKSKVVGKWKVDESTVHNASRPDPTTPGWNVFVTPPDLRFTFKADGTMTVTGVGPERTGKWTLNDHDIIAIPDQSGGGDIPLLTISEDGQKIHVKSSTTDNGQVTMDLVRTDY